MNRLSLKKSLPQTDPLSVDQWSMGVTQRTALLLPMPRRVGNPLAALRNLSAQLSEEHTIVFILAGEAIQLLYHQQQTREQDRERRGRKRSRGTGTEGLPVLC